ncbi:PspC domain-containing protein [Candidatus Saccharibacteria bacterium]|nr:PspC domain-containing protein [Candidatus Saccharibacteria bacterium]
MKEITRIHLAKTPFSAEIDAKKSLEKYLNSIQKNMHAEPEAMQEIEARMVELLAERGVAKDGVIGNDDVLAIQKQMGEPRDFSDDSDNAETDVDVDDEVLGNSSKQLMRDTEHGLIGGVCAGVAAYFGVNPLWIRLIAIFSPFITFGTAVLIYIVMWLSIPEARTASDKLRMRGEPVTLDALKRLSIDDSTKKQAASTAAKIFRFLLGIILAMIAFGLLVALLVGGVFGFGAVAALNGFTAQSWAWGLLCCLVLGGAVLFTLTLLATWSVFTWKLKRPVIIAMLGLLMAGAVCLSGVAIFSANTYSNLTYDYEKTLKVKTVDASEVAAGAKSIVVDGNGEYVAMEYGGYAEKTRLEVKYHDTQYSKVPEVKLRRDGDKLVVNVKSQIDETCSHRGFTESMRCRYMYGPASIRVYGPVDLLAPGRGRDNTFNYND